MNYTIFGVVVHFNAFIVILLLICLWNLYKFYEREHHVWHRLPEQFYYSGRYFLLLFLILHYIKYVYNIIFILPHLFHQWCWFLLFRFFFLYFHFAYTTCVYVLTSSLRQPLLNRRWTHCGIFNVCDCHENERRTS